MTVAISCPNCGRSGPLPAEQLGRRVSCPRCKAWFTAESPTGQSPRSHPKFSAWVWLPPLLAIVLSASGIAVVVWLKNPARATVPSDRINPSTKETQAPRHHSLATQPVGDSDAKPGIDDKSVTVAKSTSGAKGNADHQAIVPPQQNTTAESPRAPTIANDSQQPPLHITDTDIYCLTSCSCMYYLNREIIKGRDTSAYGDFETRSFTMGGVDLKIATLLLARHELAKSYNNRSRENAAILKDAPDAMRAAAIQAEIRGALAGIRDEDIPSLSEIRDWGPVRALDRLADMSRENEIAKTICLIGATQIDSAIAEVVEKAFGLPLSRKPLVDRQIDFIPVANDEVGMPATQPSNASRAYIRGRFVKLTFGHGQPISNVILVGRLKTKGPSTVLPATVAPAFGFNAAFGYGDKNPQIAKMMMMHRFLDTMPKAHCAYIASLKPGDVVHFPLGNTDASEFEIGGSVTLYSSEGYLAEFDFTFSQSDRAVRKPTRRRKSAGR